MLINLSNHPSDRWSDKQREAAIQQYDAITDIPFPNIPPAATLAEVQALADTYLNQIQGYSDRKVVHLMGEMTFVHQLVQRLMEAGIPAVASTSQRNTVEHPDGSKTVHFDFVQFRPYY